jgi:hypothetical protein
MNDPTSDAGHTTAGASPKATNIGQFLALEGGPHTRVRRLPTHRLSAFGLVANETEFVAVGIADVCPEVVWVVVGTKSGLALANATKRERKLEDFGYGCAVGCSEGHHLTVTRLMRLPIERRANDKEWSRSALAVPAGPRTRIVAEPQLVAERTHDWLVKRE